MNLIVPLALAYRFEDFTVKDTVFYSIIALFFILFALYYGKSAEGVGMEVARKRKQYIENHPEL